jgi:hypothetical protein
MERRRVEQDRQRADFMARGVRHQTNRDFWGNHTGLLTIRGSKRPAFNAFVKDAKRF